jgi:antitoxin HicB
MKKFNKKHIGQTLDSFLKEEGILEKTEAVALKRIIAYQLLAILENESITQTELAQRMKTSKAAINRLLNPENPSITLSTLLKVAHALGKNLQISIA